MHSLHKSLMSAKVHPVIGICASVLKTETTNGMTYIRSTNGKWWPAEVMCESYHDSNSWCDENISGKMKFNSDHSSARLF
jgi:hypothetical protein